MSTLLYFLLLLLLLRLSAATTTQTPPTEIQAIKAFKSSITPSSIPPYSCLSSWNFSSDPCSLPRLSHFTCGLSCSTTTTTTTTTHITAITLDPAAYSGTLTTLLHLLPHLTHLDLSDNSFHGPIPTLPPSLQTITLRSNSFSGSLLPLTTLTSLTSLDLSHNSLSGPLPQTLSSMHYLTRLDLSFNKLIGSLPKLPPNLLELALKSNSLSGSISKLSFDGSTQLEVIELSTNSFTGTLQPWLFLLPSLQQLDLSNNTFTGLQISKPSAAGSDIVAVDLGYNKIEGYVPINFSGYPLLSSISLRHNRLRGPIPLEFSQKQSIRRLYLDGNFLNGKPPVKFFSGDSAVSGSLGDNCLQSCPLSSVLCLPTQKPTSVCQQAYGKPRS